MGAESGMGTHERLLQVGLFASFPLNILKLCWFCGMMSDLGSLAGFPLQEGTITTPNVDSSGDVQAAQSSVPAVGKICPPSLHIPWEQWQGRILGTVGNSSQQTPPSMCWKSRGFELESPLRGNAGVCAGSTETLGAAAAKI